jgi:hypothetical protein
VPILALPTRILGGMNSIVYLLPHFSSSGRQSFQLIQQDLFGFSQSLDGATNHNLSGTVHVGYLGSTLKAYVLDRFLIKPNYS